MSTMTSGSSESEKVIRSDIYTFFEDYSNGDRSVATKSVLYGGHYNSDLFGTPGRWSPYLQGAVHHALDVRAAAGEHFIEWYDLDHVFAKFFYCDDNEFKEWVRMVKGGETYKGAGVGELDGSIDDGTIKCACWNYPNLMMECYQ